MSTSLPDIGHVATAQVDGLQIVSRAAANPAAFRFS